MSSFLLAAALAVAPFVRTAQTSDTTHQLSAADLATFLDGLVPREIARANIAGAVVAVVKDGALLFARGYGYSDVARKIPVSPDSTVFRIASISKLFNATAVMQLVEQGKLDLDRDIDSYLDFKIRRRFPAPITLRHILTHTAGFEESFKQLPADSGKSVPIRKVAMNATPAQIYPPGTVTSYSNYAVDLSGYIVERVSGIPYAEYIRAHVLEPLGMLHSSIAEPLPPALRSMVSKEYGVATDSAGKFEILQGEASGNVSATAADVAKFAIAHLQLGRFGDQRILREETARQMAASQFRTHPEVTGMGLGFFEESRNGHRIIGHGGDLSRFHSHLSLLMDQGVGFFISVNSAGNGGFYGVREAVRDGFLNRYFPRTIPIEPVVADAMTEIRPVTGAYTMSRRGETSLGRVLSLLLPLSVDANSDGSIQIPFLAGANGEPIRWYPIGRGVFRSADGAERIGYVAAGSGLPDRIAVFGGHELHRLSWVDAPRMNLVILGGSVAVFLGTLLLWPAAALARRRYRAPLPDDGVSRRLRLGTRVVALINLGFLTAMVLFMYLGFSEVIKLDPSSDPILALIRVTGLVGALGTVLLVVAAIRSWRRGTARWARFKYVALALAGIGFSWFIVHWHWLAANFGY